MVMTVFSLLVSVPAPEVVTTMSLLSSAFRRGRTRATTRTDIARSTWKDFGFAMLEVLLFRIGNLCVEIAILVVAMGNTWFDWLTASSLSFRSQYFWDRYLPKLQYVLLYDTSA